MNEIGDGTIILAFVALNLPPSMPPFCVDRPSIRFINVVTVLRPTAFYNEILAVIIRRQPGAPRLLVARPDAPRPAVALAAQLEHPQAGICPRRRAPLGRRSEPLGRTEERLDAGRADGHGGHEELSRGPSCGDGEKRDGLEGVVRAEDGCDDDEASASEEHHEQQLSPDGEVRLHDDRDGNGDDDAVGAVRCQQNC